MVTRGTISDHKSDIKFILKRLDEENLAIKLEKCEFAKTNITWLGYDITQTGISPNAKKTKIHTEYRTAQNIETTTIPNGINSPVNKIYPYISKPTRPNQTIIKERKHY